MQKSLFNFGPKPLILASQSPRRKEILSFAGVHFEVQIPPFEEWKASQIQDPELLVRANAEGKAETVAQKNPDSWVLGVDTVVALDGKIFEKPTDAEDAKQMLKQLQGRTHTVFTGMTLAHQSHHYRATAVEKTEVEFLPMDAETIERYVATGEPLDKSGSYAVQGIAACFIRGIRGDVYTVVGLPLWRLYQMMLTLPPKKS